MGLARARRTWSALSRGVRVRQGAAAMRPHIYRVDKFKVPAWSRAAFIDRVDRTHERLRAVPGFVLDAGTLSKPTDTAISLSSRL